MDSRKVDYGYYKAGSDSVSRFGTAFGVGLGLGLGFGSGSSSSSPTKDESKGQTSSRYDDNDDEFEVNNARASFHSRSEGASASLSAGRSSAHRKGQQSGRSRVAVQPFHESSRRIRGQFAQRRIVDDEERRRQAHEREAARRERIRRRNVMIRKSNRPLWHAKGKENAASGGSSKASAGSGDRVRAEYLARGARKPPVPRLSKSFWAHRHRLNRTSAGKRGHQKRPLKYLVKKEYQSFRACIYGAMSKR